MMIISLPYALNRSTGASGARLNLHVIAPVLAAVALLSSAFHFWPFEKYSAWQFLCPSNLAVIFWMGILVTSYLLAGKKQIIRAYFPHVSVQGYLLVSFLSLAFSPDPYRTLQYAIKLLLMFIGAYTLFHAALSSRRRLNLIYALAAINLIISISFCLIVRIGWNQNEYGFHQNAHKFGSYIGMLTPLCSVYLLFGNGPWKKILAVTIIICSTISAGTVGTLGSVFMGLTVAFVFAGKWTARLQILISLMLSIIVISYLWNKPVYAGLRHDMSLLENHNKDVKQRYLEWQAQLNLLESYTLIGVGAGCINEYRSNFYYRLPKLNTLAPFDQNGWLATAAEIGILGLMCLIWIYVHHFKLLLSQLQRNVPAPQFRFNLAGLAGLTGACVANIFSSVAYNGILVIFVIILVLINKSTLNLPEK